MYVDTTSSSVWNTSWMTMPDFDIRLPSSRAANRRASASTTTCGSRWSSAAASWSRGTVASSSSTSPCVICVIETSVPVLRRGRSERNPETPRNAYEIMAPPTGGHVPMFSMLQAHSGLTAFLRRPEVKRHLRFFLRPNLRRLLVVFVLVLVTTALPLAMPFLYRRVFETLIVDP